MSNIYVNKSIRFEIEDFEKTIEEFVKFFKHPYDSLNSFANELSIYGFAIYLVIDGVRIPFGGDVPLVYFVYMTDDGSHMYIQFDVAFDINILDIPTTTILKYELPDELRTRINAMIK